MASEEIKIIVLVNNENKQRLTSILKPKFLELGIGTIDFVDNAGVLEIASKIKATQATDTDQLANKGQVDTVQGNLDDEELARSDADTALQDQIDDNDTDIGNLQSAVGDNTTDIGTLQTDVSNIQGNVPKIYREVVSGTPKDIFTLAGFTVDEDDNVIDLQVYVDGRWQAPLTLGFTKTAVDTVQMSENIPVGKEVIFFKPGSGVV